MVYTATKPFHPDRLHALLSEHFSLIEEEDPSQYRCVVAQLSPAPGSY
jgi:hypothetical protein